MTRTTPLSFALLLLLPLACGDDGGGDGADTDAAGTAADGGTATDGGDDGGDDGGPGGDGQDDGADDGADDGPDDGADDGPEPEVDHALGTIVLREQHQTNSGSATGGVGATFVPDAALAGSACTQSVEGCEITLLPDCATGCGDGEYCGFDDGCVATCLDFCDASCGTNEVCYFAAPGQAACRDREDFDAGSLTFDGTTAPITLLPPYALNDLDTGSPFTPGGEIGVQASGAVEAGFAQFQASFTATTLVQGQLDAITITEAYGDGDMPVRWGAGSDDVSVTVGVASVNGLSGSLVCPADDASGSYNVPRAAILAAVDGETLSSLTVLVSRRRTEVVKGLSTVGTLLYADVQPVAWLELTSVSTEARAIEGCGFGEAVCNEQCVDVGYDEQHCGGCNQACAGECYEGMCFQEENTDALCDDGIDNDQNGYFDCEDFSCLNSPAVSVCDSGTSDGGGEGEGEGGESGGANPNSCQGNCGGPAPGGCYCDDACVGAGDCCGDYVALCT